MTCRCGKVCYETEAKALEVIAKVNARNEKQRKKARLRGTYMCHLCSFWHVTRMKPEQSAAIQKKTFAYLKTLIDVENRANQTSH